jgi:ribosomal protein S18 acetylase RimI-like enzyme
MTHMKSLSVTNLTEKDVAFTYRMTVKERWNVTEADVECMFDYEPGGCFIAKIGGVRVGNVFTVDYGRLGWIGLLIVRAEYRKRGIATLLMRKAIGYLTKCRCETIKLEAAPEASNLYRRLGFIDEFDSLRFMRKGGKLVSPRSDVATPMQEDRMTEIARFDAEYFGAGRGRVLTSLHEENRRYCFAACEGSDIVGYIMGRKAHSGYNLGPFVCNPGNPRVAQALLAKCLHALGSDSDVYLGVPAVNEKAVEILAKSGFVQYSRSFRMRLGKKLGTEKVDWIFAIGSPMKG